MKIDLGYKEDFNSLIERLQDKYPTKFSNLEGFSSLNINNFSKDYFSVNTVADVSVDDNSNVANLDVIGYNIESKKPFARVDSYYMLYKRLKKEFGRVTAEKIIESQFNGDIYINDFHGISAGMPYCFNFSTMDIATNGLNMVNNSKFNPPRHLCTFMRQIEQFTVIASNSLLGASGLSDLLITMSSYIDNILKSKQDDTFKFATREDVWKYVESQLTNLIYTLNFPLRANQSPFTNVSLYDDGFLTTLLKDYINPITFEKINKETVEKVQEIYLSIMNNELERTAITFPITSACFSVPSKEELEEKGFKRAVQDKNFLRLISRENLKFAFINIYAGESSTLSSCCRLRSEIIQGLENEYVNSFGSGGSKIGSLGVVTINLPRIAFKLQEGLVDYNEELEKLVEYAFKINYAKRLIVEDRIDKGYHPLYELNFMDINKQYLTVGINGFNEFIEINGENILEKEGEELGLTLIQDINAINKRLEKECKTQGIRINCEQIPAESTAYKLALKDNLLGYNEDYELYSNQFIPLTTQADLLDRIRLQGVFDSQFSGGSIAHLNIENRIEDVEKMEDLIKTAVEKGVIYFAVNYNLQECKNGHMSVGKKINCDICGDKIINNYTRTVGFLTNTKNWNRTRREHDYPFRKFTHNL